MYYLAKCQGDTASEKEIELKKQQKPITLVQVIQNLQKLHSNAVFQILFDRKIKFDICPHLPILLSELQFALSVAGVVLLRHTEFSTGTVPVPVQSNCCVTVLWIDDC